MKAKPYIYILLTTLILSVNALARLGESYDELTKRYGPAIKEQPYPDLSKNVTFSYNGFIITVFLIADKSEQEDYEKIDKSEILVDEVTKLLQANASGSSWKLLREKNGIKDFSTMDDLTFASSSLRLLTVMTVRNATRIAKAFEGLLEEKKKDQLDGF